MDRKYKVLSATSLINMSVVFQKLENPTDSITIRVSVDYANEKVYFEDKSLDIDYLELEQEILSSLRPPMYEAPSIPTEVLQKIAEVKMGKYGTDDYYGVYQ
jgi:hypothetical protein